MAYGARLESGLGVTPQGFESPILRQMKAATRGRLSHLPLNPQEQAIAKSLQEAGRLGAIHLALLRGTVFLEIFAHDLAAAQVTVLELPMSKWWDLDVFPLVRPH